MKKIGIVSALGREIKFIKDNIKINKTYEIKGYRFSEGSYNNLNIILGITSVGKVNAALCTEILINNFNPEAIINTGIAGALTDKTNICDIVIADSISYHDVEEYILKGCFPFTDTFISDLNILNKVLNYANTQTDIKKIHTGRIISGDSFISSKIKKEKLVELYNPLCVEMEGAAVAHVCHINKIPFLAIRSISDKADDSAHEIYKENEIPAANQAGKFVVNFLQSL